MTRAIAQPSALHLNLTTEHSWFESCTWPNINKIGKRYTKYKFKKAGRPDPARRSYFAHPFPRLCEMFQTVLVCIYEVTDNFKSIYKVEYVNRLFYKIKTISFF